MRRRVGWPGEVHFPVAGDERCCMVAPIKRVTRCRRCHLWPPRALGSAQPVHIATASFKRPDCRSYAAIPIATTISASHNARSTGRHAGTGFSVPSISRRLAQSDRSAAARSAEMAPASQRSSSTTVRRPARCNSPNRVAPPTSLAHNQARCRPRRFGATRRDAPRCRRRPRSRPREAGATGCGERQVRPSHAQQQWCLASPLFVLRRYIAWRLLPHHFAAVAVNSVRRGSAGRRIDHPRDGGERPPCDGARVEVHCPTSEKAQCGVWQRSLAGLQPLAISLRQHGAGPQHRLPKLARCASRGLPSAEGCARRR